MCVTKVIEGWCVFTIDGRLKAGPFLSRQHAEDYIQTYNDLHDAMARRAKK